MRRCCQPWCLLIALVTVFWAVPAIAQINVQLVDPGGAPIVGADIFTQINNIKNRSGTTNSQGEKTVTTEIPVGTPVDVVTRVCGDGTRDVTILPQGEAHECEDGDDCECERRAVGIWGPGDLVITLPGTFAATTATGPGLSWYVLGMYDLSHWYKFKDVSGDNPAVETHDATTWSSGVGAYVGIKLGDRPAWGMIGGHYTTLETNTTLQNGDRITGDIKYTSIGASARWYFGQDRFNPFIGFGGTYAWDKGDFTTTDGAATSEERTHESWRGEVRGGATYWATPRLGIDVSAAYNTAFQGDDADDHLRYAFGLVYNGGMRCGGQCGGSR